MKKLTRRDFLKTARNLGISIGLIPLVDKLPDFPLENIEQDKVVNEGMGELMHSSRAPASATSYSDNVFIGYEAPYYLGADPRPHKDGEVLWSCKHCGYVGDVSYGSCPGCGSHEKEKFVVS